MQHQVSVWMENNNNNRIELLNDEFSVFPSLLSICNNPCHNSSDRQFSVKFQPEGKKTEQFLLFIHIYHGRHLDRNDLE